MKIDCHVHSRHSPDSFSSPEKIAARAAKIGLDAVAIANHNVLLPQAELDSLDTHGVWLIPACEYSTEEGHVLALFLSRSVEEQGVFPQNGRYPFQAVLEAVRAQGGVAVLAHPFAYGRNPSPAVLQACDGLEAANSRCGFKRKGEANALARKAAEQAKLQTAGSDGHFLFEIGRSYAEIPLEKPYTKEGLLRALGDHPAIFSRPTNPMVLSMSQMVRSFKERDWLRLLKSAVKLLGCLAFLAPALLGVRPYHRNGKD